MKYLFLILSILISGSVLSQVEGLVIFEETVNLHKRLPEENAEMKAMIPEFRTVRKQLVFNNQESFYSDYEDEEDDVSIEQGPHGNRMRFRMMRPVNKVYKQLAEQRLVEEREFLDKKFLIMDKLEQFKWKLTGESKQIMDYTCQKATFQDTSMTVEAWFTPQILVMTGPGPYGNLPGLILEVNINDGERVLKPATIDLKPKEPIVIEEPTKGKEVTREEFREIMSEKMKEMGAESRGGGLRHMIIRQ